MFQLWREGYPALLGSQAIPGAAKEQWSSSREKDILTRWEVRRYLKLGYAVGDGLPAGCSNPSPLLEIAIRAEFCSVSLRTCPSRPISFFCSAQFQPKMLLVQELSREEGKCNEILLLFSSEHTPSHPTN